MFWMVSVYHDRDKKPDSLLTVMDAEIESLRSTPVDSATLARAKTKMRSALYGIVEEFSGLGKLDLLASFALFDNDPQKINTLEDEIREGHSRADSADSSGIPAERESDYLHHRPGRERMISTRMLVATLLVAARTDGPARPGRVLHDTEGNAARSRHAEELQAATHADVFARERHAGDAHSVRAGAESIDGPAIRTGKIDEGPNDVSLASVVGDMMREGTTTRTPQDVSRQAADMGGSVDVFAQDEMMSVSGTVLSDFSAGL